MADLADHAGAPGKKTPAGKKRRSEFLSRSRGRFSALFFRPDIFSAGYFFGLILFGRIFIGLVFRGLICGGFFGGPAPIIIFDLFWPA
jgi:hypothetical protein